MLFMAQGLGDWAIMESVASVRRFHVSFSTGWFLDESFLGRISGSWSGRRMLWLLLVVDRELLLERLDRAVLIRCRRRDMLKTCGG